MALGHDLSISVLLCDEPCEILKVEIFIQKKMNQLIARVSRVSTNTNFYKI